VRIPKPTYINLNIDERQNENAESLFEFTSDSRYLVLRNPDGKSY